MSEKIDPKSIRYVQTPPGQTLDINNVGLGQPDLFGDSVFPAKIQKHGEIFSDVFVGDLTKAFSGLGQGIIFGALTAVAFIYLPKTIPFIFVPMALGFISGIGFATARIWFFVYNVLDRPTGALKQAGGDGWMALARQEKSFQDDMAGRFPGNSITKN